MQFSKNAQYKRALLSAFVAITLLYPLTLPTAYSALQGTKISLSLSSDKPLRGDLLRVSGRLSTIEGDVPIPLVTVRLQYHRVGETDVVRDVTMVTSNPGGIFEDLVNTTYLLRIGTWVVDASFASQLGYQETSTVQTFAVVVQPTLSLYLSTHSIALGKNVTFNGLLFACIPCIHDQVTVILTRPDNTSVAIVLSINATGGPYPGGYYEGAFAPDLPGQWSVRVVWKGNDVTLPAYSQIEQVNVEPPGTARVTSEQYMVTLMIGAAGAILLLVLLRRKQTRGTKRKQKRGGRVRVSDYTSAFIGILNFWDLFRRSFGAGRSPR